jgi:NADPH-dependent curcumin reductase CurA
LGPKYSKEHQENVSKWLKDGELIYRETVIEGIDNAIGGFIGMLQGKNFGKAVLKVRRIRQFSKAL